MTTYRVATAAMGHCIVMTDDDGNETVIESGIKSWEFANRKRDKWERDEAKARKRAGVLGEGR